MLHNTYTPRRSNRGISYVPSRGENTGPQDERLIVSADSPLWNRVRNEEKRAGMVVISHAVVFAAVEKAELEGDERVAEWRILTEALTRVLDARSVPVSTYDESLTEAA